jgi:hypothetical protein
MAAATITRITALTYYSNLKQEGDLQHHRLLKISRPVKFYHKDFMFIYLFYSKRKIVSNSNENYLSEA